MIQAREEGREERVVPVKHRVESGNSKKETVTVGIAKTRLVGEGVEAGMRAVLPVLQVRVAGAIMKKVSQTQTVQANPGRIPAVSGNREGVVPAVRALVRRIVWGRVRVLDVAARPLVRVVKAGKVEVVR